VATNDLARQLPTAARTIPLDFVILFDELMSSSANELSKFRELASSCIARKVLSSLSELDTQHTSREPF